MPDDKDVAQEKLKRLGPYLGVYRHYKGPEYVLFAVSLMEDTLEPLAHYYSLEKKTRWTRTCENFSQDVTTHVPRFQYVRQATVLEILEGYKLMLSLTWVDS